MAKMTIDKTHSEAFFQVRHLLTKVRGRFRDFSGTIDFDEKQPEKASVTFTIQTASIDTDTADRDTHLRSADFFDVEKYPTITFQSTRVTKTSSDSYAVTGNLQIHGVTREVTIPTTYLGSAKDPWGNLRGGFEAETTINRKDFGLNWNTALETGGFLVGDDVKITFNIQAVVSA
jgi:polyisoprenoid-binding protein YceI